MKRYCGPAFTWPQHHYTTHFVCVIQFHSSGGRLGNSWGHEDMERMVNLCSFCPLFEQIWGLGCLGCLESKALSPMRVLITLGIPWEFQKCFPLKICPNQLKCAKPKSGPGAKSKSWKPWTPSETSPFLPRIFSVRSSKIPSCMPYEGCQDHQGLGEWDPLLGWKVSHLVSVEKFYLTEKHLETWMFIVPTWEGHPKTPMGWLQ